MTALQLQQLFIQFCHESNALSDDQKILDALNRILPYLDTWI